MPITIKANVAGPTLLGAYASGKAKGEARRMEQAMAELERNKRMEIGRKYQLEDLATERKENDFNFNRKNAMAEMPIGVQGNLRAARAYGQLQAEEQKIYSGLEVDPRSPEGQDRLRQIQEDKRMLEEVNPNPTAADRYDSNRVTVGPDGKTKKPDGTPYAATDPGARTITIDENGREIKPIEDPAAKAAEEERKKAAADAAKEAERATKAKEKAADDWVKDQKTFANDERKRQLDALKDKPGDHATEIDAINSEYQKRLESLNNYMQNYGLRQPETPSAPVTAQVPTGGQLVGGALGEGFPTGMTTPGGGVVAPPAAPMDNVAPGELGPPAAVPGAAAPEATPVGAGSFPVGADPNKTDGENFEDIVKSYMEGNGEERPGMSEPEARSAASRHWQSDSYSGGDWDSSKKGGLAPNSGTVEIDTQTPSPRASKAEGTTWKPGDRLRGGAGAETDRIATEMSATGGRVSARFDDNGRLEVSVNGNVFEDKYASTIRTYLENETELADVEAGIFFPGKKYKDLSYTQQMMVADSIHRQSFPDGGINQLMTASSVEAEMGRMMDQLEKDGNDSPDKIPADVKRQLIVMREQREKLRQMEQERQGQ